MAASFFQSRLYGPQFGDPELAEIVCDESDAGRMVLFERALARVQGRLDVIPAAAGEAIYIGLDGFAPDIAALAAGVSGAGVPVPALVAELRKALPPEHGRWLHWGATSQDVIDTAQVLMLAEALDLIGGRLTALVDLLERQSRDHRATVMAGRTRGQIATPITLGLKIAQWAHPLIDLEVDLPALRAHALVLQFGGASGANSAIAPHGPAVAAALAAELDLVSAPPWHAHRAGFLDVSAWLMKLAVGLSKMAGDLIMLMRSEIGEISAGAGGGSSTMPQKQNPVGPETVCALALLAQAAHAGLAAAADHREERDGTKWAVEWALLPQVLLATGGALRRSYVLAETLEANPERMRENLNLHSGVMAEQASFVLAAHMARDKAQALVKQALRSGKPLAEALVSACDLPLDWKNLLRPETVMEPCQAVADQIFAKRPGLNT